jgi:hypothetical protein
MRSLSLFLLLVVACERDQEADLVVSDSGSTTVDGRSFETDAGSISRPGAGPLDPDQTFDCVSFTIEFRQDGRLYARYVFGFVPWTGAELPRDAWLCFETPYDVVPATCAPPVECSFSGERPPLQKCTPASWHTTPDGSYFASCYTTFEADSNGDGLLDQGVTFGRQHVAVVY